ncbi:hypothetical protein ACFOZ7_22435 [Natribaculum luteum]|uniref:Small CPxCG-related zinc finger protein n=1 Tax=Natribaculum luteum TaxID=1586232 RepID=A0ABD5P632_9EURY|nr:hypothetical protein [Natribaculum luteum]
MGIVNTIREAFGAIEPERRSSAGGAYWCDDCAIRRPVDEAPASDADRPSCPECGESMRFERSPDSAGCAC